jgi:hypothetical protein
MTKAVGPTDDSIEATRLSGAPVFVENLVSLYIMLWVCPSICDVGIVLHIGVRMIHGSGIRGLTPGEVLITELRPNA